MTADAPPFDRNHPANQHLYLDYWDSQPEPRPESGIPGMSQWGWMSVSELRWIHARAREMTSVAEIGVLHGRSAYALLDACPGPVWCVDPWNDAGHWCIKSFLESCGHFPNVRPIVGYSPAVIADYGLPDVDMVWIDGDHSAAGVRADIEGWLPKTRRLICGHDYIPGGGYADVAVVVDDIFGDRVQVAEGTAIWFVEIEQQKPRTRRSTSGR